MRHSRGSNRGMPPSKAIHAIATLKDVPGKAVTTRPSVGIRREKRLHAAAEVRLRSFEHHVQVIGHDREGVDMPGAANRRLTKLFLKPIAINVVAHDVLPPITAGHDMINRVGVLKARSSWHALHCNMLASGSQESC